MKTLIDSLALTAGLDYRLLLKPELLQVVDFALLGGCVCYLALNPKVRLFFSGIRGAAIAAIGTTWLGKDLCRPFLLPCRGQLPTYAGGC